MAPSLGVLGRPEWVKRAGAAPSGIIQGLDPTEVDPSDPILLFIIQAGIIIIVTRLLGLLLSRLRQPRVIAEVIGGILLGPTVMGHVPGFTQHIFPSPSLPYLNLVSSLGLVLFLFLVGVETDLRVIRRCAFQSLSVSLAGMVIPFGLGAAVSVGIYDQFINKDSVSFGIFLLFTGVAMAITAFPVLARILTELKLLQTDVGVLVLAAGVGNDVVGWILLALTVALVNAATGLTALWVLLCAVAWTLVLFFIIKPVFLWLARRGGSFDNGPTQSMITLTLLLVLISAWVTDVIGVHPIFGAFLVGLIIPHEKGFAVAVTERFEDLVSIVFLPLYFALSGLKTNLGSLNTGTIWGYTVLIIVLAFVGKLGGCASTAKLVGFSWRESATIGTLMSCKGLVELIVLNVGLSAGILDTRVFSMFVVMALVSTCITTPLTLFLYPAKHRKLNRSKTLERDGHVLSTGVIEEDEKMRDDDDDDDDDADAAAAGDASSSVTKRLLVVLSRMEHLPALMTFVQLLHPPYAPPPPPPPTTRAHESSKPGGETLRRREGRSSTEKEREKEKEKQGAVGEERLVSTLAVTASRSIGPSLAVDALRLIELTERTSAVMKVSESEETMRSDPVINVFRTFGQLNHVPVRSSMAIVSTDEFGDIVCGRAREQASDLVVLPWILPPQGYGHGAGAGVVSPMSPYDDAPARTPGARTPGATSPYIPNPFESIFGSAVGRGGGADHHHHHHPTGPQQAQFVRRVFAESPSNVGLYLEGPGSFDLASPGGQHVFFAFFGGPDDRAALELVVHLCTVNVMATATIVRISRSVDEDDDAASLLDEKKLLARLPLPARAAFGAAPSSGVDTYHHADTVRSATAQDVPPTFMPQTTETRLQSDMEDDLAFAMYFGSSSPTPSPSPSPAHPPPTQSALSRIEVRTVSTRTPLRTLVDEAKATASARPEGGFPRSLLVLLGRGRRLPAFTHREEMLKLLKESALYQRDRDRDRDRHHHGPHSAAAALLAGGPSTGPGTSGGVTPAPLTADPRLQQQQQQQQASPPPDFSNVSSEFRKTVGDAAAVVVASGIRAGLLVVQTGADASTTAADAQVKKAA